MKVPRLFVSPSPDGQTVEEVLPPMRPGTGPRVLVVDADPEDRTALVTALEPEGVIVESADTGSKAVAMVRSRKIDLIISDYGIPGMTGLQLLASARVVDPTIGFILVAETNATADAVEALRQGADDYILEPFHDDELRHSVFRTLHHRKLMRENRRQQVELEEGLAEQAARMEKMFVDALLAIAGAIEIRDGYFGQHVERVTRYAIATGRKLGLEPDEIRQLWIAGMLHDIGKVRIPDEILTKPTRLTPEEDEIIKRYPVITAGILDRSDFLRPAVPTVLHQHERWDGGGYPDGLAGKDIPVGSRILGVAEAYDALVTPRPYRAKRSGSEALSELRRCAGAQFDPVVVDAFILSFGDQPPAEA